MDQLESYDNANINPLDSVEDILSNHNWTYDRTNQEEIIVEVAGKSCNYRLLFVWQEHMNALQLCCQYDLQIKPDNIQVAATALMDMNSALWMGHFELSKGNLSPHFRQTCLIHEHDHKAGYGQIEDLVDISLIQCERYQSVFYILAENDNVDAEMLSFAMMETAGES